MRRLKIEIRVGNVRSGVLEYSMKIFVLKISLDLSNGRTLPESYVIVETLKLNRNSLLSSVKIMQNRFEKEQFPGCVLVFMGISHECNTFK